MEHHLDLDPIDYDALVAEFDGLWSRTPLAGDRQRMDQILRLIEALDATRRMAASA